MKARLFFSAKVIFDKQQYKRSCKKLEFSIFFDHKIDVFDKDVMIVEFVFSHENNIPLIIYDKEQKRLQILVVIPKDNLIFSDEDTIKFLLKELNIWLKTKINIYRHFFLYEDIKKNIWVD